MIPPVVSVVIPTHDRPAFLREALISVLENGFPGTLEIIVSDDSATGSARPVVEALGETRIRYVRNPESGMIGNWDFGLRHATGRYATKLDDDNRFRPGFLQRCVAVLESEPEVASVYTAHDIIRVPERTNETVVDRDFFGSGRVDGFVYARAVLTNEGGYPRNQKTSAVFRIEAARQLDFYRFAREDFAFSAALGLCGAVAYLPEVLYEWRIHAGSGIQDLYRTFRASRAACEGLLHLPVEVVQPERAVAWERAVRQSQGALPLCYLRTAFVEYDRATAWKLWRQLCAGKEATPPVVLALCVGAGMVLPQALVAGVFSLYRRSGSLQALARAILR